MKKNLLMKYLSIVILSIFLSLSLLVVRPIYIKLSQEISGVVENFSKQLKSSTGISFSYKSLSPSIFTGFQIKGIELAEVSSGKKFLEIKRTFVRYSFFKIISGKGLSAFKDITVDGFTFKFDKATENEELERLKVILGLKAEKKSSANSLYDILGKLNLKVLVKNVHIFYNDYPKKYELFLKKLSLMQSADGTDFLPSFSGSLGYYNSEKKNRISVKFSSNGSISKDFENSVLTFRFSDFTSGLFNLSKFNLIFNFDKNNISARTIQNTFPLFAKCDFDLSEKKAAFSIETTHLKAGHLISVNKDSNAAKKVKDCIFSIKAEGGYEFEGKKLNYSSFGKISLPDTVFHGGFDTTYSFYGSDKKIYVKKFSMGGENIDADFSGDFSFSDFKLSGAANLNSLVLPNGGVIATEVYFDPLDSGFIGFAPQLMFGEKFFTALQLTFVPAKESYDFDFEMFDYAHIDSESPGSIKLSGSFMNGFDYVQANLSADKMFLDSLAQTAAFFSKNKNVSKFAFLSPFLFNAELYMSSDMKTFSFSLPYAFVANTKKDGQFLYIALDGNENSLNLNKLDFLDNGKLAHLSAFVERSPDSDGAFFTAEANAGGIPYHLTGNIAGNSVSITGDYDLAFDLFKNGKGFDGNFYVENLPLDFSGAVFSFSADTGINFSENSGLNIFLTRLEAYEITSKLSFSPRIMLSGLVTKYGADFNSIVYSDKFSILSGNSSLSWSLSEGIFESLDFSFNVNNPSSSESVAVNFEASNPNKARLSIAELKSNFYINSQVVCTAFGLNRFFPEESENNIFSGTVIASGVVENPYIGLEIENLSFMTAGKTVLASAKAYVEDKIFKIDELKLNYNNMLYVDKVSSEFNLSTFTGKAVALLDASLGKKSFSAPIEFTISDTYKEEGKFFPSEFAANLYSNQISGTLFKKKFPFSLTFLHSSNNTVFFTGDELGVRGNITDTGGFALDIDDGKPLDLSLTGNIGQKDLNFRINNIFFDIGRFFSYFDIGFIKIYKGIAKGSLRISGLKSDPDFSGAFALSGADFSLPTVVPNHITIPKAILTVNHNEVKMQEVKGAVKNIPVYADLYALFERWAMIRLESHIYTPKNVYAPVHLKLKLIDCVGEANIDLNLALEDKFLDITGDVRVKKTTATADTRKIAVMQSVSRLLKIRTDINLTLGPHTRFNFEPIMRVVFVPEKTINFKYDMAENIYSIDGDIQLRSGDIAYLSRNFYLKRGSIRFNGTESTLNPLINVHAETREKDEDGNDIRLILTAENQFLLDFNPKFSSIPAKSESEIQMLLGQVAVADAENVSSLLLATGDYAIQSTIGRSLENKLRDFLNFDILSVRTNVLQNALKQGLLNSSASEKSNDYYGIGNFFDNSTVYIGKYFGSSLYADSLLHWTYDESKLEDSMTLGGLVFRPEFGIEFEAPFANIRFSTSPDIDAMFDNRLVSSTSITLSWKISF